MLVSTREATREPSIVVVEILTRPAPILAGCVRAFRLRFFQLLSLEFIQPFRVVVKQGQPLLDRQLVSSFGFAADQFNPNALPGGYPLQLVPRLDAVLVGNRLRHS